MSHSGSDKFESDKALNIPNILADFFLKKMPSYSDDSDYNRKEKKKKSKHKKRKHKKSKHKHRKNSSISSADPASNNQNLMEDVSSSEELGMKRLKKIKDLKLNSANKNILQNVALNNDDSSADINNPTSNSNIDTICYGPSLESSLLHIGPSPSSLLIGPSPSSLLAGVESNHSNPKPENVLVESDCIKIGLKCENSLESTLNSGKISCLETENNGKNSLGLLSVSCDDLQKECDQESVNNLVTHSVENKANSFKNNSNSLSASSELNETNIQNRAANGKDSMSNNTNISTEKNKNNVDKNIKCKTSELNSECNERKKSCCRSMSISKPNKIISKHKHKKSNSRSRSPSQGSNSTSLREKKKRYSRSRSSSLDKSKLYRKRLHSRSHSRSCSRSRHSKYKRYSRSRSPYKKNGHRKLRSRSNSRSRYKKHYETNRSREYFSKSKNESKFYEHYSHSRSSSRSKSKSTSTAKEDTHPQLRSKSKEKKSISQKSSKIDQAKVLETAKMNIRNMIKNGTLPEGLNADILKKEQIISIQAGGKSVQELTEYCQRLSQKENDPDENDKMGDDDETEFIHHPFKMKEPAPIKMNIKSAIQQPVKTQAQKVAETARLSSQFPVSSGNEHRQKELQWIPVLPDKSKSKSDDSVIKNASDPVTAIGDDAVVIEPPASSGAPPPPPIPVSYPSSSSSEIPQNCIAVPPVVTPAVPPYLPPSLPPPPPLPPSSPVQEQTTTLLSTVNQSFTSDPTLDQDHMAVVAVPASVETTSSIFKLPKKFDISSIVAKRFQALSKLQHSPNDPEALRIMQEAEESIQEWVQSQQVPGLFTGSTDARVLSAAELCGPKYYKFRKNMLTHAPPVTEGKGMSLLKKMGWNPGEGLGKNKEGSLEPLVLDIKMDKKGLVSEGENSKKVNNSFMKELQGKHPVSALMELCSKRRWKPPLYTCVLDHGPPHKKLFCFKVEVNGVEYQPLNPCSNKKVAKADSAILCLQSLNVFPKKP